jgi:hypothetical protein
MREDELQKTLDMYALAQSAEEALGELYLLCGRRWPEEEAFWLKLAEEERQHVEDIRQMGAMLRQEPDRFQVGRLPDPSLFRGFVSYLGRESRAVQAGDATLKEMLEAVRDIEQSVIDFSYPDFVATDIPEFAALGRGLSSQTMAHRQWIVRKIAESNAAR